MPFNLRVATENDIGEVAAMIMAWHRELPEQVRFFDGNAMQAERSASILVFHDGYVTKVIDAEDEIAGGYSMGIITGVFSDYPYGQLLCWYVRPRYRGHNMLGLKMLMDAMKQTKELGLDRLEVNPWVEDAGTQKVLSRLKFVPGCTMHFRKV